MEEKESLEVQVARIDVNVKSLLEALPLVRRHDKELFALKILAVFCSPIVAGWVAQKLGIMLF